MDVSPARDAQSSSPLSEPEGNASSPANNRRKSGRTTRKPELFSQASADNNDTGNSGRSKRKRATPQDEDNEDEEEGGDELEQDEQDASGSEESEADEEELKEKRRAARRASGGQKKKPNAKPKAKSRGPRSAKKPKITNGFGTELAIRPAVNGKKAASRPKKARAKPGQIDVEEDGLFGRDISSLIFSLASLIYVPQRRSSREAIQPKQQLQSGSCNTNGTTSMPCAI